jgi:hypothetical protein
MTRFYLSIFALIGVIFISGCAASEAAQEDQVESGHKFAPKVVAPPVNNGSAVAAKMISPVTGY